MNSFVFSDFQNTARDAEERTASGRLFQTEVTTAEKALLPVVAGTVREMTTAGIPRRRTDSDKDTDADTDSDSDSSDTSTHPYVRYARFPRDDHRENVRVAVGVGVRVGAVECQL